MRRKRWLREVFALRSWCSGSSHTCRSVQSLVKAAVLLDHKSSRLARHVHLQPLPGISSGGVSSMLRRLSFLLVLLAMAGIWIACGGGNNSVSKTTAQPAPVTVSMSDPTTCSSSASGLYKSVFVTVTDVQINASSTAGDNAPSWIDLTPNLKTSPQQVDLLGVANSQCFLASLGSSTALQPGTYQQIRIILADNSTTVSNNACKTAGANCVVELSARMM